MEHPYEFTLNGQRLCRTKLQVENALRKVTPDRINVHAVEVNGVRYPVRQAFAVAFDVGRKEVDSDRARRVFLRMGFPVSASPEANRPARTRSAQAQAQQGGVRPRFPRARGLPRPLRVETDPDDGTPAAQVQALEIPPIVLAWSRWVPWNDLLQDERQRTGPRVPIGRPGVYEVIREPHIERLTIGRAADLRARVKHQLVMGHGNHPVHKAILAGEDTTKLLVRWALTDRPAAAEEELHRLYVRRHGRLPKYTQRT
ncbi:MAG: hypothetical protein FJX75_00175 [Armatimonadetes bacterium]|nr:hypothetical protein [Armatimonadota bacterium]